MLRPASVVAVHRRVLIERSLQSQPVFPANLLPLNCSPAIARVTAWPDIPPCGGTGR
jgi:hypothetical protein